MSSLPIIQQNIIRYGFPFVLVLGNVGNLLSIVIFSQKHHRRNPCSLYLLTSAIAGLISLNWGFGTNLNAVYQFPDPFTISLALCRIRGYILQTTGVIYRTMIVLACIDRFALSSSHVGIRVFSNPKIALKLIGGVIVFWMIASIHLAVFETIENNRCGVFGSYGLFFSIYQICLFGVLLPGLMIVFGILLWKNLKAIRVRVQPLQGMNNLQQQVLNKRDISLMKFVLAEVIVGIILNFLYPINILYGVLAGYVTNKSQERIQIEGFMSFISLIVLFYLHYCVTFYLYMIMLKSFRQEIKKVIFKCLTIPMQEQTTRVFQTIPLRELPNTNNCGHRSTNIT